MAWLQGLRGTTRPAAPGTLTSAPRGARTAFATAIKLLEKRAPRAPETDRLLHTIAPVLGLAPTLALLAVIPLGDDDPVAAPLPFALALWMLSTAAIALAATGGGNRLAQLSALRLVALRLSVLVVIAVGALASARLAGSLSLPEIVVAQARPVWGALPRWGAVVALPAFLATIAALAAHAQHGVRTRSVPSLAEPWHQAATGPVLLGHRVLESLDMLAGAAVVATLYLGGWHVPGIGDGGVLAVLAKTAVALVLVVLARNQLPPVTPGVAVRVCWTLLVPAAAAGVAIAELLR